MPFRYGLFLLMAGDGEGLRIRRKGVLAASKTAFPALLEMFRGRFPTVV